MNRLAKTRSPQKANHPGILAREPRPRRAACRLALVEERRIVVPWARYLVEPRGVARLARRLLGEWDREAVGAVYFDEELRPLGYQLVSVGTWSRCTLEAQVVLGAALLLGAKAVTLFHNHPSGWVEPSAEDVETTRKIQRAGRHVGVEVRDHVIVCQGRRFAALQREAGGFRAPRPGFSQPCPEEVVPYGFAESAEGLPCYRVVRIPVLGPGAVTPWPCTRAVTVVSLVHRLFAPATPDRLALFLDVRNHLRGYTFLPEEMGEAQVGELLREAVLSHASGLLLVRRVAEAPRRLGWEEARLGDLVREAGEPLGLRLVDQLLVGRTSGYVSQRDVGWG